jgi:hypothetical protein
MFQEADSTAEKIKKKFNLCFILCHQMKIRRILSLCVKSSSVVDRRRVDADPDSDPTFNFDADPDPDP